MTSEVWGVLLGSIFENGHIHDLVRGQSMHEWVQLVLSDYDDVDRLYIDFETIGGG